MIKNTFASNTIYNIYVLAQYIQQINGCSKARASQYYWAMREEWEIYRKEFIDDVNKSLRKMRSDLDEYENMKKSFNIRDR